MDCKDLHINGGVVGVVNCQGNVHLHGGVVEWMNVHRDCYQYGGIIERRNQVVNANSQNMSDAINEAAARHVKPYADEINMLKRENAELKRENTELKRKASNIGTIESVRAYNARLSHENSYLNSKLSELRAELEKRKAKPEETPPDDVLIYRINCLEKELAKEKESHKKDVDDLKYRYDTVLNELNAYNRDYYDANKYAQDLAINDDMFDVLFTFINLYPFTTDGDIAYEFGIRVDQVRDIAKTLKLVKSTEARREAADYLRRQHLQLIERRGGDQGNHNNSKPVEKVARYGRVIKAYGSINEASKDTGMAHKTIQEHCERYPKGKRYFTKEGFTFRYKK